MLAILHWRRILNRFSKDVGDVDDVLPDTLQVHCAVLWLCRCVILSFCLPLAVSSCMCLLYFDAGLVGSSCSHSSNTRFLPHGGLSRISFRAAQWFLMCLLRVCSILLTLCFVSPAFVLPLAPLVAAYIYCRELYRSVGHGVSCFRRSCALKILSFDPQNTPIEQCIANTNTLG